MKNNHIIPFSYNVYVNNDLYRCNETVTLSLSDKEIKAIAAIMDQNDGYPVELCVLESLSDRLLEKIYVECIPVIVTDESDYETVTVVVQEKMPAELVAAADEYVRLKTVDINYYIVKDGKEVKQEAKFGVSPKEFNAMVGAILSGKTANSDFELLRSLDTESYASIAALVGQYASVECMAKYGCEFPVLLKEFPYQVYCSI